MSQIRREAKVSLGGARSAGACGGLDTARADAWKVERGMLYRALAVPLRGLRRLAQRRIDTPQWMA